MTRILVAEDSSTQAVQICRLLQEAGYEVELVPDGKQAVRRLENEEKFDLVLTDMMMPEMDGLQLVRAIRVHHSETPVILMTGQGTDALAVEALEDGAAGYVPKSQLVDKLEYEIERVLNASRVNRSYELLLGSLVRNELEFHLRNDVTLIDPLIDLLQQMMAGMKLCDATSRVRVCLALEHALLNALFRGNLEIGAGDVPNIYDVVKNASPPELVFQRLSSGPYRERKILLAASMSPERARFVIRDEGPGFDHSKLPKPGEPDALEREGGHGLLLIQTFMDEVSFNEAGNEVTMVKRRET